MSTTEPEVPQTPYAGYGYQPYQPPQTEGMAIVALVCSIVSFVVPFVLAIAALVIAPGARRKIDASNGQLTGLGLLQAAKWLSWISLALWVAVALLVLTLLPASVSDGGTSEFS